MRNRVSFILSFLLTLYMADVAISHQEMGNSRLGLLGELGYVVTGIDSAVIQPEVRVGDIITFTNVTGQLTSIEGFQQAIRSLSPGSVVQASILRFNAATGEFEEHSVNLGTLKREGQFSRLGLLGELGYVVTGIDSAVIQPEVRVGDIITFTNVTGQLTSIEGFQQAIRSLSPGSVVQASVLRFNAATGKFEEHVANLSTFPYPTSITGLSKTTVKVEPVSFSLSEKAKQTKCVLGPCTWCCARCTSNYGGQCTRSECETGVMSCFLQNGWCRGVFCV